MTRARRGILIVTCTKKINLIDKGYTLKKRVSGSVFLQCGTKPDPYQRYMLAHFKRVNTGFKINKRVVLPILYSKIEDFREAKRWKGKAKKRA